ncbi:uncharacterized protein LOC141912756 [Tubulanus polymorphus]|uniref:uncharacterized protein LOC141912756 n=1 Tax=Tubulanus polymorphus TaxID=672921 RepID=UPI003DA4CE7B
MNYPSLTVVAVTAIFFFLPDATIQNPCYSYCHPLTQKFEKTRYCPRQKHCCNYGPHRVCCSNKTFEVSKQINKRGVVKCPADIKHKHCRTYCKQGRLINGFECEWFCCGSSNSKYCCKTRHLINLYQNLDFDPDSCGDIDKNDHSNPLKIPISAGVSSVVIIVCVVVVLIRTHRRRQRLAQRERLNRRDAHTNEQEEIEQTPSSFTYANLFAPGGVYGPQPDEAPDWLHCAHPCNASAMTCKINALTHNSSTDASEPPPPSYNEVMNLQQFPDVVSDSQSSEQPPSGDSTNYGVTSSSVTLQDGTATERY